MYSGNNNISEKRSMSSNQRSSQQANLRMSRDNSEYEHDHTSSSFMNKSQVQSDNLRVIIRVRPPLPREIEEDLPFRSIVIITLFFSRGL